MKLTIAAICCVLAASTLPEVQGVRKCGNVDLTPGEIQEMEDRVQTARLRLDKRADDESSQSTEPRIIQTHYHIIAAGPTVEEGNVPDAQIEESLRVLNQDFAATSLRFQLATTTRTVNAAWHNNAFLTDLPALEMKRALRVGGASTLNIYTVGNMTGGTEDDPDSMALGYGTLPIMFNNSRIHDSVVINFGTLPGGHFAPYNGGRTLTHEVGHWTGLLHLWGVLGGCQADFDLVRDTPPQRTPSRGCPIGKDTCPGNGPDMVWNFMDYTIDSCMTNFTAGQIERMAEQMELFRFSFDRENGVSRLAPLFLAQVLLSTLLITYLI